MMRTAGLRGARDGRGVRLNGGIVKLTPERKAAFCAALAASGGNVTRACSAVDIARMTAYEWRDEDDEFAAQWDRAKQLGLDALEDEATRRAFDGVDEPIVYQGEITGTMKRYSDTLMVFLLKGGKPEKYRERTSTELTGADGGPVQISETERAARLASLLALAEKRRDKDPTGLV